MSETDPDWSPEEFSAFADNYTAYHSSEPDRAERLGRQRAGDTPEDELQALLRSSPHRTLDVVMHISSMIEPYSKPFHVLAAGVLEYLIHQSDASVQERLVEYARTRSRFRMLLSGTWISGVAPPNQLSRHLGRYTPPGSR